HNADHVLARTSAGTLKLDVDDVGLKFRAKIPNASYGNDLAENLRNGNVNQCSFGFCLDQNGDVFSYAEKESIFKRSLRSIKEIVDVSALTDPAYRATDVAPALRSLDTSKETEKRKLEEDRMLEKEILSLEFELM